MEQGYRGLKVYGKSYALSVEMYKIASRMPKEERYGLSSQIKRAATSIPLNIAEGHGKMESELEFKRYLLMAKGSCNEMQVLLDLSKDLGYMSESQHKEFTESYDEVGRMLSGLIKTLKTVD
ncbi:hypothetical protein SDC9_198774 [bioreactor metagenome]|uniref:Four helix bundle protein n=1 Tax=bioreactor metagenome TaxID=1076179 RepID=A0A645IJU6_9ZZZZ